MEREFIPYQEALALKELGFDEPCFGRYYYKESYPMLNPNSGETELVFEFGQYIKQTEITILAPLYQQAFRWFREKGIAFSIVNIEDKKSKIFYSFVTGEQYYYDLGTGNDMFATFEEAELACLIELIEIVKGGKQ
jgi:hypothetical protein